MDKKLLAAIEEVEGYGDRLLQVKAQLVELDKERNKLREGSRALRKLDPRAPVWTSLRGGVDIRLPSERASAIIKDQQEAVEAEVDQLHKEQKKLVAAITERSGTPEGCGPQMLRTFLTWDGDDKASSGVA